MKALKDFIITFAMLVLFITTSAFNTTAFFSNNPSHLKTYFIANIAFTIENLLANSYDTIEDGLQNDYLKQIFADILNLEEGKTGEIINKFSGDTQNWNWKLHEGILPSNYNGTTELFSGGVLTTLNYAELIKATNLSVARTIIHELIHAYLTVYFRYDQVNAGKDYPEILRAWQSVKNPDYNEVQHDEIEKSFVEHIASALKEYGQSIGLNIDENIYSDLAWGRLDFENSSQLSDEDKVRIQHRLSAEQLNIAFLTESPAGVTAFK